MTTIRPAVKRIIFHADNQYQHNLLLEHQGQTYNLQAGTSDKIHIFTRSICIYVLTINKALGYIGLDAYMPKEPDPINSIFLHSEYQITEALGHRWNQMNPSTMATRLIDYLI